MRLRGRPRPARTGYDVVVISETACGAADLAVIAEAVAEERILITEDTDFGQLVLRQLRNPLLHLGPSTPLHVAA